MVQGEVGMSRRLPEGDPALFAEDVHRMAPAPPVTEAVRLDKGRCSSCGAEIVWALTEATGARICLEARPLNVFFIDGAGRACARKGYETHFAHCPAAAAHRRAKR